jgi:HSP20 family protein
MTRLMIRTRPSRNLHHTHWGFREPIFQDFNRLLAEMVQAVETKQSGAASPEGEVLLRPRLDITETASEWSLTAELPGVPTASIQATVRDDILEISGAPTVPTEENDAAQRLNERRPGRFFRQLKLPVDELDIHQATAVHHHGLLTLTIPRRVEAPPAEVSIPVTTGSTNNNNA